MVSTEVSLCTDSQQKAPSASEWGVCSHKTHLGALLQRSQATLTYLDGVSLPASTGGRTELWKEQIQFLFRWGHLWQ